MRLVPNLIRIICALAVPQLMALPALAQDELIPDQNSNSAVSAIEHSYAYLGCLQRYQSLPPRRFDDARGKETLQKLIIDLTAEECRRSPDNCDQIRRDFEKDALADLSEPLPTIYEDALTFSLLRNLSGQIEDAAARLGITKQQKPLFGTLETLEVNAMAIIVPETFDDRTCDGHGDSGHYIIALERQLFNFANLFSKAVTAAMPIKEEDDAISFSLDAETVRGHLAEDEVPLERFAQVLGVMANRAPPGAAPQYLLLGAHAVVYSALRDGMELFIVAHEYAHTYLDHRPIKQHVAMLATTSAHLGAASEAQDSSSAGDLEIQQALRSYDQELQADALGLLLFLDAMSNRGGRMAFVEMWAPHFFFTLTEIVDRSRNYIRSGEDIESASTTHPLASARRKQIRNMMVEVLDVAPTENLGQSLHELTELLWEELRTRLDAARPEISQPPAR